MATKQTPNEKKLKAFLKEIEGSIFPALIRERIVHIMKCTVDDIKENPEEWKKGFVSPKLYIELNEIVTRTMGFEE